MIIVIVDYFEQQLPIWNLGGDSGFMYHNCLRNGRGCWSLGSFTTVSHLRESVAVDGTKLTATGKFGFSGYLVKRNGMVAEERRNYTGKVG